MPNYVYSAFSAVGDKQEFKLLRMMVFRVVEPDAATGSLRKRILLDSHAVITIPTELKTRGSEGWAAYHWARNGQDLTSI